MAVYIQEKNVFLFFFLRNKICIYWVKRNRSFCKIAWHMFDVIFIISICKVVLHQDFLHKLNFFEI